MQKEIGNNLQRFSLEVPRPSLFTKIVVGKDILPNISRVVDLDGYNRFIIVTEDKLANSYSLGLKLKEGLKEADKPIKVITSEGTEKNKTLTEANRILKEVLSDPEIDRKTTLILNLGGGVIGDVGGFVASQALRGIDCFQIPTTLLAMADSSLGGKTGVDYKDIKNRIGLFHLPRATIMDIDVLKKLPERQIISGFGELIKHAFSDIEIFNFVSGENIESIMKDEDKLIKLLELSARYKMGIVTQDFEEKTGARQVLNLGHTLGHAIESVGGLKQFTHGEAVAIGLTGIILISNKLELLSDQDKNKILEVMRQFKLPTSTVNVNRDIHIDKDQLWKIMGSDKKAVDGIPKFVLIEGIGKLKTGCKVEREMVDRALDVVNPIS